MSLLDKYFGSGTINDRYGKVVGYIEHVSDNRALIHDEQYSVVGSIEAYGNEVRIYDAEYNLKSRGSYYEELNRLDIRDLYGNLTSSMEQRNGCVSQTERYDITPSYYYSSSEYGSSDMQSESDGLGPEFWDNIDDDDDDDW